MKGNSSKLTYKFCFKLKMANKLSVMANPIRNIISGNRNRLKDGDFNLDLVYIDINKKIIAMGYPATNMEKFFRNDKNDVLKFFNVNHPDHFKVYNLCSERKYEASIFNDRVACFPFVDHCPPTIELIYGFCEDVDKFLQEDTRNVVAVHCKAGKGRTGTMISCYLVYRQFDGIKDDKEALEYYGKKRTTDGKGVTIPSQRRYVNYFSQLINNNLQYKRTSLQICEIQLSSAPLNTSSTSCQVFTLQNSLSPDQVTKIESVALDCSKNLRISFNEKALIVSGDVKIELKNLFHLWFNTFFVNRMAEREGEGDNMRYKYVLSKNELDGAHKEKSNHFAQDFKITIYLKHCEDYNNHNNSAFKSQNSQIITNNYGNNRKSAPIIQNNSNSNHLTTQSKQQMSRKSLPNQSANEVQYFPPQTHPIQQQQNHNNTSTSSYNNHNSEKPPQQPHQLQKPENNSSATPIENSNSCSSVSNQSASNTSTTSSSSSSSSVDANGEDWESGESSTNHTDTSSSPSSTTTITTTTTTSTATPTTTTTLYNFDAMRTTIVPVPLPLPTTCNEDNLLISSKTNNNSSNNNYNKIIINSNNHNSNNNFQQQNNVVSSSNNNSNNNQNNINNNIKKTDSKFMKLIALNSRKKTSFKAKQLTGKGTSKCSTNSLTNIACSSSGVLSGVKQQPVTTREKVKKYLQKYFNNNPELASMRKIPRETSAPIAVPLPSKNNIKAAPAPPPPSSSPPPTPDTEDPTFWSEEENCLNSCSETDDDQQPHIHNGRHHHHHHHHHDHPDYYSSICDNQLSFNNSPCKSPSVFVSHLETIPSEKLLVTVSPKTVESQFVEKKSSVVTSLCSSTTSSTSTSSSTSSFTSLSIASEKHLALDTTTKTTEKMNNQISDTNLNLCENSIRIDLPSVPSDSSSLDKNDLNNLII